MACRCTCAATLLRLMIIGTLCLQCHLNPQQLQLVAHENDRTYIPCFNRISTVWSIKGVTYSSHELPRIYSPRVKSHDPSNGLIILRTLLEDSGIYFCHPSINSSKVYLDVKSVNLSVDTDACRSQASSQSQTLKEYFILSEVGIAFIPCALPDGKTVTVWGIDGALYPVTALPPQYFPLQSGLIVAVNALRNPEAKILYQCFSTNNVIEILYSIELFLCSRSDYESVEVPNYRQVQDIDMVTQQISLQEHFKQFGLKIIDDPFSNSSSCEENLAYSYGFKNSDKDNATSTQTFNNSTQSHVLIPSADFKDPNSLAYIDATNSKNIVCARTEYNFRVNSSEVTDEICEPEGGSICIELPDDDDLNGKIVLWPQRPNSDNDCICPLFRTLNSTLAFEDCYCLKRNLTVYNIKLLDNQLCWMNLAGEMNNTKIIFAQDTLSPRVRNILCQTQMVIQDCQSQQQISLEITFDNCRPTAQCVSAAKNLSSNVTCIVRFTTDRMYRTLSDNITSQLDVPFEILGLAPDTTYYFTYFIVENESLLINETKKFSTGSFSLVNTMEIIIFVIGGVFLLILFLLITISVLICVMIKCNKHSESCKYAAAVIISLGIPFITFLVVTILVKTTATLTDACEKLWQRYYSLLLPSLIIEVFTLTVSTCMLMVLICCIKKKENKNQPSG